MGIVAQLHDEINKSWRQPDGVAKFQGIGFELGGTPQPLLRRNSKAITIAGPN